MDARGANTFLSHNQLPNLNQGFSDISLSPHGINKRRWRLHCMKNGSDFPARYNGTAGSSCSQLLWMKQMLSECNVEQDVLTLCGDNKSARNITKNPIQHSRTKHIDVCHHFIRDLVEDKVVTLEHVATDNQLADIFTKALDANKFETLRGKLGICLLDDQ
ncbi:hypothetical protein QL285_064212 [Trifolium repens]|nr:hypothetical protein QL285_064212 [Trifolium repens]